MGLDNVMFIPLLLMLLQLNDYTVGQSTLSPTTVPPATTSRTTTLATTLSPGFVDVPASVSVLESLVPRVVVAEFQVQSSSSLPVVLILSVTPAQDLFESPVVNPTNASGIFHVQIILNGSLDFESIRLYSVRLGLVTASGRLEQTLHVRVEDANEPPECDALFQLPGAEVHVPENHPVPVTVYTVLASDPDHNDTVSFSISQVLPASSRSQFHVDGVGSLVSSQAFDYSAGPREFVLSVTVSDRQGANCTGTVKVKVLKVLHPPLHFLSQNVSIFENEGPEAFVASVKVNSSIPDVRYTFLRDYPPFRIREDGVIRTTYNLDLEVERGLAYSELLVRAYSLAEGRGGTATVTVTVLDVNEHPPFCSPPVLVLEVPETTEVGRTLGTVRCVDLDVSNQRVSLSLMDNALSFQRFRLLDDGQLQVNNTLDYDSAATASNRFQYEATILATDLGAPPRTAQVRVLVTVTPVNEFEPGFLVTWLQVPEDTRPGTAVGVLLARDADWPFDNIRYSILAGDAMFTIDPDSGQLYLDEELDFERQQSHQVTVQAEDYGQDVDPTNQRKRSEVITIRVENVNDNAPVCAPVSYESTIFSTRSAGLPILSLSCSDADGDALTSTITNGAAVDRFRAAGLTLFSQDAFSYVVDGVYDHTAFQVTLSVSDGRHQTEVVAYINVVPWTTTVPTATTTTTTQNPQVVTVRSDVWDPDPWFVAVVTITGALFLVSLGLLTWAFLKHALGWGMKDLADQPPTETGQINKHQDPEGKAGPPENDQCPLDGALSLSKVSLQDDLMRFDGKAQDPVSGRCYLFNSTTGDRRWL